MSKMIFKGDLITGDFQDKTMTFEIEGEMTLQAGNYTILPTKMYEELVNGANTESKALHIDSVMPRKLTAENGAKSLLIGEFHETIVCHDEDGQPYEVKMPVEWDTIKAIYDKIVAFYGA